VLPPLPSKPLSDLTEADLLRLVEDEVREDVEIDYKVRLETDCQEFARDISAFANSKGGYLVYGMSEVDELPKGLVPLEGFDPGTAIGRMTSWAQEHVRPRPTLQFKPVQLEAGGAVMVVEVPRSWVGPHEVRQEHRFYHRTQHGKAPMDVDQIRQAFGQDQGFTQAVEKFREDRSEFWRRRSPGLGAQSCTFLLHLLPAEGLMSRRRISLTGTHFNPYYPVPHPANSSEGRSNVWRGGTQHGHNLDGFYFQETTDGHGDSCSCQVFRNGAIEHKWVSRARGDERTIFSLYFDQWLYWATVHGVEVLKFLEVQGPIALVGSFLGTHGWEWPFPSHSFSRPRQITEGEILLPDLLLESTDDHPGKAVEQLSGFLWNAMGWPRSPNFEGGEFKPK
jgi:hypothetical protein